MDFMQKIGVEYPPNNKKIFEEWFLENYTGCDTDREIIPVHFTSFWVNHDYGNDLKAKEALQFFIDSLPNDKKYFIICQYDDGVMVDWKGKDVLEFNMSKKIGIQMPLLCQPHPYLFSNEKKWFASFIGSHTHPIREHLWKYQINPDYYISFDPHQIQDYCKIMSESLFALAPRGWGLNSFRIAEAMQYDAIPVYISDEFIGVFDANFEEYGVLIKSEDAGRIDEILDSIPTEEIIKKQENLKLYYDKYYTYEGAYKQIIKQLESEYHSRKSH